MSAFSGREFDSRRLHEVRPQLINNQLIAVFYFWFFYHSYTTTHTHFLIAI